MVACENFSISLTGNCFSMIGRLEIERTRHAGNRDDRRNLGAVIPHEILLIKARLPEATNGKTGTSPKLEKLCLMEIKIIGKMPAIKTRNMSDDSFECFSVILIDRFMMDHRISNIPQTRIITIEIFSPRWT